MAKTKKSQAPPAAGQQINKYYNRYIEDKGKTTIEGSGTDGYTLYRALARQVIGYPSRFLDIRNAVLQFYFRVYANQCHPLHDECARQAVDLRKDASKYQLFALLDSPDLQPNGQVLWVIAYALKIRIDVFESVSEEGEPQDPLYSIGPPDRPVCVVVRREATRRTFDESGCIGMPYFFESLLPDESGKALIRYLQAQREEAALESDRLQVKQISWAWKKAAGKESWTCFNEYRPESKESDLEYGNVRDRMDTFVVTINESRHIGPALELFREALRRAPNQRRWVRHSNNKKAGFLLPHCSVDAEFVKMEKDVAADQGGFTRDAVHDGILEELCSVLTFAVGRHFFLLFDVVHMLETSDKLTVPALTTLFRQTIFDKNLLKLWWNPQSDIAVLNGTIGHLYQKTRRKPYNHCPYGSSNDRVIEPRWRIKSNHFQNSRPDDLNFPTDDIDCQLHRFGANEQDITCCCRLGNIDIAALFGYFCRMHGFGAKTKQLPWTEVRSRFRYDDLLERMLGTDRLYPLLSWMKSRPGKTGKSRDAFYQDMGEPTMQQEDDVMAYNIGDVAGQNLIFEQLLASDDKDFIAGCLSAYGQSSFCGSEQRRLQQRPSPLGRVGGIQLWEDNPRSFQDKTFDFDPSNPCWPKAELYNTDSLTPWEHDRKVQLMREMPSIVLADDESHYSGAYILAAGAYRTAAAHQRDILASVHDPTRLDVSQHCVQDVDAIYEDPVVRAGHTHSEALLELLKSSQADATRPPPGFGAAPGERTGLPAWLKRVPGQDLDQARNIYNAFEQSNTRVAERLGKQQAVPDTSGWLITALPSPRQLFEEAWQAYESDLSADRDQWTMAHLARSKASFALAEETTKNKEEGLPYSLDTRDVFDLEGREFRRRAERAQSWNRPVQQPKLTLSNDGSVKSLAAMQLEVLCDRKRFPDDEGFEPVVKKLRRRYF